MLQIEEKYFVKIKSILCKYFSDEEMFVFGSRSTGTAKKYSDLDIAIKSNRAGLDSILSQIKEEFEESDIPFKIDLIDLNKVSNDFKNKISCEMQPLDIKS